MPKIIRKPKQKTLSLTIKYTDLQALVEEGKNIVATPKAEEAIVKLLTLEKEVQAAIETAKKIIEEQALKLNPNFSSVRSDRVKAFYRTYGQKYAIDESKVQFLPKDLYKTRVTYTPDSKALEAFVAEKGALPDGIITRERTKSLSISLIEDEEAEQV